MCRIKLTSTFLTINLINKNNTISYHIQIQYIRYINFKTDFSKNLFLFFSVAGKLKVPTLNNFSITDHSQSRSTLPPVSHNSKITIIVVTYKLVRLDLQFPSKREKKGERRGEKIALVLGKETTHNFSTV